MLALQGVGDQVVQVHLTKIFQQVLPAGTDGEVEWLRRTGRLS